MAEVLNALDSAEVASIQAARADMVHSVLAANWESFAQLYDEQTIVMPPNLPPLDGRPRVQAFGEGFPEISALRITPTEIDGRVDLAYERGRFEMTAGGVADGGSYLTLWRRQTNGSWKIFRDIWHSDRAASA